MIEIKGVFKATIKELPKIKKTEKEVSVYFISKGTGLLYKGIYHANGYFYAYSRGGGFDCFANATGVFNSYTGENGICSICVAWCYIDDLTIIMEGLE